jgi:multidrug resistance protein MdtO
LAAAVTSIRNDLMSGKIPVPVQFNPEEESASGIALLAEMQVTVTLIPQVFTGSRSIHEHLPSADDIPRPALFAPDALVNPDHVHFALKGCLAASSCYVIYNAIAWPGISTAVTTCLLTALSTIGASRQKQMLRVTGAIAGGILIGMGSQLFIMPYLDSIAGFVVLFVLVTAVSSWFMTSSPRLSYFGMQLALAFYLINLQEFAMQTSLSIARDRVVGILLGLLMMWLVFDQLWSAPAGVGMKKALGAILRLLAQLAREPVSNDFRTAIERTYSLRETIHAQLDKVRSLADGVLFEFGPSRHRDIELRSYIREWQPQLRTLFVLRIASLRYRLQLPGFELPETVRLRQQAYDEHSARMLEDMADWIEHSASPATNGIDDSHELLKETLHGIQAEEGPQLPTGRAQSLISLLRCIGSLTTSLTSEIAAEFGGLRAHSNL